LRLYSSFTSELHTGHFISYLVTKITSPIINVAAVSDNDNIVHLERS